MGDFSDDGFEDGDDPFFVSFPSDLQTMESVGEVLDPNFPQFGQSEAGCIEQQNDQGIAFDDEFFGGLDQGGNQALHTALFDKRRESFGGFECRDFWEGIFVDHSVCPEVMIKRFDGRDFSIDGRCPAVFFPGQGHDPSSQIVGLGEGRIESFGGVLGEGRCWKRCCGIRGRVFGGGVA